MIKFMWFIAFILRVSFKEGMGRWYYLRDEPEWAVKKLVDIGYDKNSSEGHINIVKHARQEMKLRSERPRKITMEF